MTSRHEWEISVVGIGKRVTGLRVALLESVIWGTCMSDR